MKKKIVFDSYALLAYLEKERNYQRVKELLSSPSSHAIIMNEINIGEVYYIIARERAFNNADYLIEIILPSLPIEIISNSFAQIIDAAKLKAHYPLSFADCFAIATCINEKGMILTGDPEFKKVESLIDIEWL